MVWVVSMCSDSHPYLRTGDRASEWVRRLALAFRKKDSRRDDILAIARAVQLLEDRCGE
jgi:hypothetical protein